MYAETTVMIPYGDEDPGADERPTPDDAVHHPGEAEAEHQLDDDAGDGDDRGGDEVVPPDRVGEHGHVVGEPDELLARRGR